MNIRTIRTRRIYLIILYHVDLSAAGDVITKPTWGKDQPNNYNGEQNCVVLDGGRELLWNDVGCNLDYLHWICQYSECVDTTRNLTQSVERDSSHQQ